VVPLHIKNVKIECQSRIDFIILHLIHCKLLRDFNWKSRTNKNQIMAKLKF